MKQQQGFTLIEVIISIGLIGVMLLLYYAMYSNVIMAQMSKRRDVALKIASHEMEYLRSLGYSSLPASASFSDSSLSLLPSSSANFEVSTYNAKTKQVVVTVSWSEAIGSQNVSLSTLMVESGGLD